MAKQQNNTNDLASDPNSRKLKFAGICKLNNDELSSLYNIDQLTDEELASVNLDRNSLIDDYRLLHEVSQMKQIEKEANSIPVAAPAEQAKSMELHEQFATEMEKYLTKKYTFPMLNHLIKLMSWETEPQTIFNEKAFQIDVNYHEDEEVLQLEPNERLFRRLMSFYDHLEDIFVKGNRKTASDLVFNAIIRLIDRSNVAKSKNI
ncbi:uncharacterized protein LOC6606815 [Drosophila sechellia]|uniref:GM23951 n=1 Tax=Drosophila sechellia TaxID=7238 RepID=B4HI16_DROSE|nr:uncharacterized protein LOC6606815 [Drosophila sechellia]EDW42598.1 GM23951 [Drosophila sechellia]